jgi:hypothetical protein
VNSLVEDCIPNLVSDQSNSILTALPSISEIHNVVFSLNRDSSPALPSINQIAIFMMKGHHKKRHDSGSARILSIWEINQQL